MKFNIATEEIILPGIKIKVLKHLMQHEALMGEREIASVIKVSHMSVNRALKELSGYNIVTYSRTGKTHLWKINKKSYVYRILSDLLKTISSLETPIDNLKKTIRASLPSALVRKVILFGSVAKGLEKPESDIDLFILVNNRMNKVNIQNSVDDLSNKCLDLYGNRLEAYILTENELKQKKALAVLGEVEKGIQIFP